MTTFSYNLPLPTFLRTFFGDHAIQIIAAMIVLLWLLDLAQLLASMIFVGWAALSIAPVLLASAAAAAWIEAAGAERIVAAAFRGHPARMVIAAALVGALSPFCSCGVIPIITGLLASGVPLAPVMAFWLSSPLMDPAMFFLTLGTLGLPFAIGKTAAAIGVGLSAGFGTMALVRAGLIRDVLRQGFGATEVGTVAIGDLTAPAWRFWRDPTRIKTFRESFGSKTIILAKWLIIAFLLESMMIAYVPNELVFRIAGGDGMVPILLSALVGIPAYLNGYAALPLVAGLIEQGLSKGAAMAFLIGGGATSIPAALVVWSIVRPRVFAAYVGFAFTGAIASGWIYGYFA